VTAAVAVPSRTRGSRWLLWAAWLGLTIALAMTVPALPWQRAVAEMKHLGASWLLAAVLANLLILPLWTVEWQLLVPGAVRVSLAKMLEIVAITAAVLNSVPFLAGEASAVLLLIGRGGLSRGAALSVLAMDQLLVGFAKVSVVALAAVYAPVPDWLRAGVLGLVVGVTAMFTVLLPLAHHWRRIRDRLLGAPGSSRSRQLVARILEWGRHLEALRAPGLAARLAALALGKKALELCAVIAVQLAFGLDAQMGAALLVLAALALTTLLPVAPANLGVYEATVFAIYRFVGISSETALGMAIVQHLCFLLPSVATGYLTITTRAVLQKLRA
jgi:glycosyltransferase 2 family protein